MRLLTTLVLAASLCLAPGAAMAGNIGRNPGAEAGGAHWESRHFIFGPSALWAHTDPGAARLSYCAAVNCLDSLNGGAFVGQLLATRPGDMHDLSFWVRSFDGERRLSVFWDRTVSTQQTSFSGLVASAGSTLLQVHGGHLPFDDFSALRSADPEPAAASVQSISEPGAFVLLLAGLLALALAGRRG